MRTGPGPSIEIPRACLGAAFAALMASACSPPPHAAVVACTGTNVMDYHVEKDCTVTVERFKQSTTATIQTDTRKRKAVVTGQFTVREGTVRVELRSSAGSAAEAVISPGNPGTVEGTLPLRRHNNDIHIRFHPEGEAVGVEGSVHFEAR
ncbi:hypothetical protein BGP89_02675 [Luteimonas sp. JM171]|uniref:hypothetical protein n=1 Tax=Luteimonas sp. JM171 TaxID=1896164 RepID=UPI000856E3FA|nr:hypothetical protein [Luteimonas sp. JM171]AOH35397.1 hypothetical protein BGP89_02675 [Luteimonas sp. JM171]